jgi:hypothetical protein
MTTVSNPFNDEPREGITMPTNNYFFFDGSALIAEIRSLQESDGKFKGRRLFPVTFVNYLRQSHLMKALTDGTYRRAVFYFAQDDPQVAKYINIPDKGIPIPLRTFRSNLAASD